MDVAKPVEAYGKSRVVCEGEFELVFFWEFAVWCEIEEIGAHP